MRPVHTFFICILLIFYTVLERFSIDFGSFNLYFHQIFGALYFILYCRNIKHIFVPILILTIPYFETILNSSYSLLLFGTYEFIFITLAVIIAKHISTYRFNIQEINTISFLLNSILILYALIAILQLYGSFAIKVLLDNLLYFQSGNYDFRYRVLSQDGVFRAFLNFSSSTSAAGHMFLITFLSYKLNNFLRFKYTTLFFRYWTGNYFFDIYKACLVPIFIVYDLLFIS